MSDLRTRSSHLESYIIKEASRLACDKSAEFYRQRLLSDSARLFQDREGSIEAISWPKTIGGPQIRMVIESSDSLKLFLGSLSNKSGDIVYVIRQKYSWDKLAVTRELLLDVLETHGVFLPFLDSVSAFGFKLHDDDETWEGYHEAAAWEGSGNQRTLVSREISYTYRYYTQNGRNEDPKWSLRQTAVYQKTNEQKGCSVWILIQPSAPTWRKFQNLGHAAGDKPESGALHMIFLNGALEGWKGFVTELRLTLNDLV
jgi:hypothetical protein